MKRFFKLSGIGMALALAAALTGCSENPESGINLNGLSVIGTDNTAREANSGAVVTHERADQGSISISEPSSVIFENAESAAADPTYEDRLPDNTLLEDGDYSAPKDYIPEESYEFESAIIKIIDTSITVEVLEENIAEYNANNQIGETYNVTEVTVLDDGEEVSSGLLKDGMYVRVYFGGGYTEYRVIRAPRDYIPEESYEFESEIIKIIDTSITVEALEKNIAEYNANNQIGETYNVTEVTVLDDGEEVSSGLLKDGMYVRVYFGSGYTEYRVIRAPKDCIPDDARMSNAR